MNITSRVFSSSMLEEIEDEQQVKDYISETLRSTVPTGNQLYTFFVDVTYT